MKSFIPTGMAVINEELSADAQAVERLEVHGVNGAAPISVASAEGWSKLCMFR